MDFYDISAAGMHLPGTLNLASKRKVWPGGASQPVPPRRRAAAPGGYRTEPICNPALRGYHPTTRIFFLFCV
jgi:hypothetical protein